MESLLYARRSKPTLSKNNWLSLIMIFLIGRLTCKSISVWDNRNQSDFDDLEARCKITPGDTAQLELPPFVGLT